MESLQNNSRKGKKTSKLELYLYEANSLSFIKIILFPLVLMKIYYQRLTLESKFTNLLPLNRSQQLPAQYKGLIDGIKQN